MIIVQKNRSSALNLLLIFYNFANIWHGQILAVEMAKLWRMGRAEWRKIGSLMLPIGHNSAVNYKVNCPILLPISFKFAPI